MSTQENETIDTSETETEIETETKPSSNKHFTMDDLTDLVKAIKFAYPDYGIRKVHREIVEVASINGNEPTLKDVKLNDVKKIWKKIGLSEYKKETKINTKSKTETETVTGGTVTVTEQGDTNSILKFYTVGDGSIQSIARGYQSAAEVVLEAQKKQKEEELDSKWFHFYLNVPADRSGQKPHQALINFSDNNPINQNDSNVDKKEQIVKIQVAAAIDSSNPDLLMPMLLYNADRSARTFIHPPTATNSKQSNDKGDDSDGGGYRAIYNMIITGGKKGALGIGGGTKGYFRCRIISDKNIVSIDTSSLVKGQNW